MGVAVALLVAVAAVVQLAVPGGWPVLLGLEPSPEDPGVSGAITPVDGGTVEELPPDEPAPRERERRRRRSPRPR
ncbi:MAG: hypothetical protein M5U28_24680 [Sandaracinaceae bacterium]|nr:hypothetical protein [Sandaracinaceae bacterium]